MHNAQFSPLDRSIARTLDRSTSSLLSPLPYPPRRRRHIPHSTFHIPRSTRQRRNLTLNTLHLTAMLLLNSFFDPTGTFFWICGIVASLGLVLGYVPQAIQTIRTRKTDDIALPTFLMIGIGGIAFMLQGIMLGIFGEGFAIFWTNLITTVCSVIIFGIKMYNDYFKKK